MPCRLSPGLPVARPVGAERSVIEEGNAIMWIKAGSRYFNTDTIAYIQVSMDEAAHEPKTIYLHFMNESHTFTLHGQEAAAVFCAMQACITQNEVHHVQALVAAAV